MSVFSNASKYAFEVLTRQFGLSLMLVWGGAGYGFCYWRSSSVGPAEPRSSSGLPTRNLSGREFRMVRVSNKSSQSCISTPSVL
jgi:hypothetical protein